MSVMKGMSMGVVMAALCCVLSATAAAQQAAPASGNEQSEAREGLSDRGNRGADSRTSQQQRERSTSEGVTGRELSNRSNSRSQPGIGGQHQEVERFLAGCLLAKNGAEIELSQFAEKQSQSPEVKKFAQMMIRDHQQMMQQLEQLAGTDGNASSQADRSNEAFSTNSTDNQRVGRGARDRTAVDSSTSGINPSSPRSNAGIQQLAQIERQIVERQTQATRDDLQQKSGVEFDKCYVGTAIVAHVHMIAALQVIEQQEGPLAQTAKQARPVAEQHLEHAKQLMKQLETTALKVGQAQPRPAGTQR